MLNEFRSVVFISSIGSWMEKLCGSWHFWECVFLNLISFMSSRGYAFKIIRGRDKKKESVSRLRRVKKHRQKKFMQLSFSVDPKNILTKSSRITIFGNIFNVIHRRNKIASASTEWVSELFIMITIMNSVRIRTHIFDAMIYDGVVSESQVSNWNWLTCVQNINPKSMHDYFCRCCTTTTLFITLWTTTERNPIKNRR